jgi:hypothetical protein
MKPKSDQMLATLRLAKKFGILRPSDLTKENIPRVVLTRLTASGHLEKIASVTLKRIDLTE